MTVITYNNISTIGFAKVRPDAHVPQKRREDAGYDFYPCFDEDYIIIRAHTTQLIPTGIISAFNEKYALIFKERSSTGKKNIKVNAGVIDSGYRGEIFVCIYNANDIDLAIVKKDKIDCCPYISTLTEHGMTYPYEKAIAQAMLWTVPDVEVVEMSQDEITQYTSERGDNCLGSTNK